MKAHKTLHKLWPNAQSKWKMPAYDSKDHLTNIKLGFHLSEREFNNTIASGCPKRAFSAIGTNQLTSDTYMMEVLKDE